MAGAAGATVTRLRGVPGALTEHWTARSPFSKHHQALLHGPIELQCSIDFTTTGVRPPIFLHGNKSTWTDPRRSLNPGAVTSWDSRKRYPRSASRISLDNYIAHARTSRNPYSGSLSGSSKMPLRGDDIGVHNIMQVRSLVCINTKAN